MNGTNTMLYDNDENPRISQRARSLFLRLKRKEQRAQRLRNEIDLVNEEWDSVVIELRKEHPEDWKLLCKEEGIDPDYGFEDMLA
jgi:single-stranded DNA-specific DHH superfamily exonuclease